MSDATMTGRELSRGKHLMEDAERKLVSYDVGMTVAISTGLLITARVVNMMASWM